MLSTPKWYCAPACPNSAAFRSHATAVTSFRNTPCPWPYIKPQLELRRDMALSGSFLIPPDRLLEVLDSILPVGEMAPQIELGLRVLRFSGLAVGRRTRTSA